jgi:hypothetical protein
LIAVAVIAPAVGIIAGDRDTCRLASASHRASPANSPGAAIIHSPLHDTVIPGVLAWEKPAMGHPVVEGDRMRADRTRRLARRRSRARRDEIGWDEMTPYQRWIVEAGRATPRVQVPDTICTAEEYIAWQMARMADLDPHGR